MFRGLRDFLVLWSTQNLSLLGSSVTEFALTLWLYEKTGSALSTAALTICTYAPYVVMSILAGAVTDRLNKKRTMLVCDALAAAGTVLIYLLYRTDTLAVWHLYAINAVHGLMNTVQQPASEVAYTLTVPKEQYQRASGLQYLARSSIGIGSPLIASALYGLGGLDVVIAADLITFALAFTVLALFIRLPEARRDDESRDGVLKLASQGIRFLKDNPLVTDVILFMSGVNFVASAFDAALPAMVIPNPRGGNAVYGTVAACSGIAMVIGSMLVTVMPKPKDRVRVIYLTMLFSLGTENFLISLSRSPVIWCAGQIIGWILVPLMGASENVILRNSIPVELQGRVFACRNTLQFFTIPLGLLCGGFMVDDICEPFMERHSANRLLTAMFGTGKGSGAAMVIFILGVAGAVMCLITGQRLKRYNYSE